jgi:deoxyribodipyrimidine photo-lyase
MADHKTPVHIFWFRRDLRLHDNCGLYYALQSGVPVLPVFIFDRNILDQLDHKQDKRVSFIHQTLSQLQAQLRQLGSDMLFFYGKPEEAFASLLEKYEVKALSANHDYESYAINRDASIMSILDKNHIPFHGYKDHVIFEKSEVVKDDGKPYTVFTPYSKKWKLLLQKEDLPFYDSKGHSSHLLKQKQQDIPSLNTMGFEETAHEFPPLQTEARIIEEYAKQRDTPGIRGTSRLGIHLRFGTISIRELANHARPISETFLNELIWRDFYQMICWHFPHVNQNRSFKPEYDLIKWRNDEKEFEQWCLGQTGYPIVDAGMRELNTTGFMHNRVRMIVASFLCKHLLIDWRWGEAYFASKLLDFDFASNNGGWQWAAGSGCDAAPYFRIFNPYLQTQKFDPQLTYIRKWVPELESFDYPKPIVDHDFARKRCLEVYKSGLQKI